MPANEYGSRRDLYTTCGDPQKFYAVVSALQVGDNVPPDLYLWDGPVKQAIPRWRIVGRMDYRDGLGFCLQNEERALWTNPERHEFPLTVALYSVPSRTLRTAGTYQCSLYPDFTQVLDIMLNDHMWVPVCPFLIKEHCKQCGREFHMASNTPDLRVRKRCYTCRPNKRRKQLYHA
jgi:hypothetical protein